MPSVTLKFSRQGGILTRNIALQLTLHPNMILLVHLFCLSYRTHIFGPLVTSSFCLRVTRKSQFSHLSLKFFLFNSGNPGFHGLIAFALSWLCFQRSFGKLQILIVESKADFQDFSFHYESKESPHLLVIYFKG